MSEPGPAPAPRGPVDERWPDRFAAAMLVATSFVAVVALVPPWRDHFRTSDDLLSLLTIPIVPSLVYAALLAVMAVALRRRLRAAWWILLVWWLVLPEIGRIYDIVDGQDVALNLIGLVLIAGAIVVACMARPQFVVRRVPGSLRWALATFLVGGAVVLVGGAALVSQFGESESFGSSAVYVLDSMLVDLGRFGDDSAATAPFWVQGVVGLAGMVVVIVAATVLFRAPADTRTLAIPDEAKVRAMLRDFGDHDSLGYFATRRDKSVVWDTGDAATAQAGVSYRVVGSVSLASGNPVGDPEHWAAAIEAWREQARRNGWSVAVMGAGEEGAMAYAEVGLTAYDIGDEAIVDMTTFSLSGPGMKAVRARSPACSAAATPHAWSRHATLTDADFAALSDAARAWRGDGGDERGFSMALGRLADPLDGACVLVEAHDADGQLRGFLSFVPWGRTGLSLDLMRRDPTRRQRPGRVHGRQPRRPGRDLRHRPGLAQLRDVPRGVRARRRGRRRAGRSGSGARGCWWRARTGSSSRSTASNAKYLPAWQPRFICFEYTSDLPRVGIAAGSAEGFLTRPTISLCTVPAPPTTPSTPAVAEHATAVLALIPPPRDIVAEALSTEHLPEQMRVRRAKLDRLREQGVDPYPVGFPRTHTLAQVRAEAGRPRARHGDRRTRRGRRPGDAQARHGQARASRPCATAAATCR